MFHLEKTIDHNHVKHIYNDKTVRFYERFGSLWPLSRCGVEAEDCIDEVYLESHGGAGDWWRGGGLAVQVAPRWWERRVLRDLR